MSDERALEHTSYEKLQGGATKKRQTFYLFIRDSKHFVEAPKFFSGGRQMITLRARICVLGFKLYAGMVRVSVTVLEV